MKTEFDKINKYVADTLTTEELLNIIYSFLSDSMWKKFINELYNNMINNTIDDDNDDLDEEY